MPLSCYKVLYLTAILYVIFLGMAVMGLRDWQESWLSEQIPVERVVAIGAESPGKTTLTRKLAQYSRTEWVPENGSEHWERKVAGLTMDDPLPAWTPDEFVQIACEQQSREDALATVAHRVLICDTNAFAPEPGSSVIKSAGIPRSMRSVQVTRLTFTW